MEGYRQVDYILVGGNARGRDAGRSMSVEEHFDLPVCGPGIGAAGAIPAMLRIDCSTGSWWADVWAGEAQVGAWRASFRDTRRQKRRSAGD